MRFFTSDESKMVDIGTGSIWNSVYSTAVITFSEAIKNSIPDAMIFLKTGCCCAGKAKETEKQIIAVRNGFLDLSPEKAVYDWRKPKMPAPWLGNISPRVSSCANLYTTADGKDLFTEVMSLLRYAAEKNLDISAE